MNIKETIKNLPEPVIFTDVKVEDIIKENIDFMKSLNPNWKPIESDSNTMQIEAFAYKEVMLRNMFNNAIKSMLPHFAKGADLDNFAFGFYAGETRLAGVGPTALYEFNIEEKLPVDIVIPARLEFSDGDKNSSYLLESVLIKAGDTKGTGTLKLNKKIKTDEVKTEIISSPYPYLLQPKSLESFKGGSTTESDEEFFSRAILSLGKFSTAGSKGAYKYFTYKADERVIDVNVFSPSEGVIEIYVNAKSNMSEVVNNVKKVLNDEKVQALNDHVKVYAATLKNKTIKARVYVFDLLVANEIKLRIEENFNKAFKLNESLPYSQIINYLHAAGVYKVEVDNKVDLIVKRSEVLNISLELEFIGVQL